MQGILTTTDYVQFQIQDEFETVLVAFEGAKKAAKALPGDIVQWNTETQCCHLIRRASHPPLVGVLELTSKTTYGLTSRGAPIYLFLPYAKGYPAFHVGCSERNRSQNQIAVIDFHVWESSTCPRGLLKELLGPCGSPEAERRGVFLTYNPEKMPKALSMLSAPSVDTAEVNGRVWCPDLTFNIDPEGCLDIDDVLSLEDTGEHIKLWITIADVAAHVQPGTDADSYAFKQGSTAYINGHAVQPMLPRTYSEDTCSLLPGFERLGMSLILTYAKYDLARPISKEWARTRLKNRYQFDYDTFQDKAKDVGMPIGILSELCCGLIGRYTSDIHEWIEAAMLTYNIEVAKVLRKEGRGILRKHRLGDLERAALYKTWGGEQLATLANTAATYCSALDEAPLHAGLSAQVYCHATSPIRRYADLVNQRILKDVLCGTQTYDGYPIRWLNQRQTQLKRFERDLFLIERLLEGGGRGAVDVLILDRSTNVRTGHTKVKLWIPSWRRTLTWNPLLPPPQYLVPGSSCSLQYFANPASRLWKERVVFQLKAVI